METTRASVVAWRRALMLGITALIAALAVSYTAPTQAQALTPIGGTIVPASHVGWVYVEPARTTICSANLGCGGRMFVQAWRWDGRSWNSYRLGGGEQVYAYPYTGAWHWIWTQHTGWLAIETARLDRYPAHRCTGFYRC